LELLLVLAILAAVASVSIPHVGLLLGDRRLARAADQIRIEMTRLRVDAMRQGRVLMLEATSGGNTIRIKPFQSIADATEAMDQTGSQSSLLSGASQGTLVTLATEQQERLIELPPEISVESVAVVGTARASAIEQATLSSQMDGWSRPILFYPDGTTSTAAIVIKHPSLGRRVVQLRGIIGEATVGEVLP
jgi:Tfp pilus assembly protein FimT